MNANPLLDKLNTLRDLIHAEEADMKEAIDMLEANVESLKTEYNELLRAYIYDSKLLKNVTWSLRYLNNKISLEETDYKIDIKGELIPLIVNNTVNNTNDDDEALYTISLMDNSIHGAHLPAGRDLATLYIPSGYNDNSPYITFESLEYFKLYVADYELKVDLSMIEKIIMEKTNEIALLNQIKQRVPN